MAFARKPAIALLRRVYEREFELLLEIRAKSHKTQPIG